MGAGRAAPFFAVPAWADLPDFALAFFVTAISLTLGCLLSCWDGQSCEAVGTEAGDLRERGRGEGMVVVEGRECVETPRRVEPVNKPYSRVT